MEIPPSAPVSGVIALPSDGLTKASRPPLDPGQLNALIHLYRAEVGRMTTYRQRLDTTTNWSITSSALVTTFSLGNPLIPHEAFLFLMLINIFFLMVEARRFKVYEAARYRVLLLEHYFYPEVLGEGSPRDWRRALIEALRTPYSFPPVGQLGALGWRLRRNYLWIYGAVLLTWIAKLEITAGSAGDVIEGASIGRIPGAVVWVLVVLWYLLLVAIGLLAQRSYPMGNEAAQAVLRQEPD
ncbi:MAG TPA: DUF2270 domain-containing protein [Chloroflexota bacterium]|nr:DUF2270 domain-containing protein [Chloroflexota bacterium]